MDYTKSLDELVKRDKKLGRMRKGGPAPPQGGNGKKPNRMQQQRNMVAASKQNKGGNNQKQAKPQQQQPQRLKNRGGAIYKGKNAARVQQQKQGQGKVVRTAQGGKGRVMQPAAGYRNKAAGAPANSKQAVSNRRRQLLQTKLQRNGNKNSPQQQAKRQHQQQAQQPAAKFTPKQPLAKKASPLVMPQGTLEQRKLKVRNIDANTVTVADLQKLFSKCGALITAAFDKNMHGQYLGSATLIYVKATAAANAIQQFNGAQLDDRVMKVEYALAQDTTKPRVPIAQPSKTGIQGRAKLAKQPLAMRRGNNAIQKRGGQNNQKQGNKKAQGNQGGAGQQQQQRRGLGAKRPGGKTLRLAPAKQQQQQQQRRRARK